MVLDSSELVERLRLLSDLCQRLSDRSHETFQPIDEVLLSGIEQSVDALDLSLKTIFQSRVVARLGLGALRMANLYASEKWANFRAKVIALDGGECVACGRSVSDGVVLQVHHKLYISGRKPWEYEPLIVKLYVVAVTRASMGSCALIRAGNMSVKMI